MLHLAQLYSNTAESGWKTLYISRNYRFGNEISIGTKSLRPYIWANVKDQGGEKIGAHVRARMNASGFCKMAMGPAGLDMCVRNSLVFDVSSTRRGRELAGGSQLRSLRGVSVLPHPRRLLQPPLEHGRHLVITGLFFAFPLFWSRASLLWTPRFHKRVVNSFLIATKNGIFNSRQ